MFSESAVKELFNWMSGNICVLGLVRSKLKLVLAIRNLVPKFRNIPRMV